MTNADADPTKGQPVSVRLTPALHAQVNALAAALDRPKSWIIEQALKEYVALQAWQLESIDEGLRAANEGRVTAHADVEAWVGSWDSPAERPMPG